MSSVYKDRTILPVARCSYESILGECSTVLMILWEQRILRDILKDIIESGHIESAVLNAQMVNVFNT